MSAIGYVVTFLVTVVYVNLLRGWVLTILWRWFIVPIFHLPALTLAPAIGVSLVAGYLTHQAEPDVEVKKRSVGEQMSRILVLATSYQLIALAMGWAVHLFMAP